jgi:hypothetical protein
MFASWISLLIRRQQNRLSRAGSERRRFKKQDPPFRIS